VWLGRTMSPSRRRPRRRCRPPTYGLRFLRRLSGICESDSGICGWRTCSGTQTARCMLGVGMCGVRQRTERCGSWTGPCCWLICRCVDGLLTVSPRLLEKGVQHSVSE
jgi:hypothetical protein